MTSFLHFASYNKAFSIDKLFSYFQHSTNSHYSLFMISHYTYTKLSYYLDFGPHSDLPHPMALATYIRFASNTWKQSTAIAHK